VFPVIPVEEPERMTVHAGNLVNQEYVK